MNKMKMKRILDIKKISTKYVEVEYFDGKSNSTKYAKRKVYFPSIMNASGAYIIWNGNKKVVESLYL